MCLGVPMRRQKPKNVPKDHTLIRTKGPNRHPKDENDWQWWHPIVPETLRRLHSEGCVDLSLHISSGRSCGSPPKGNSTENDPFIGARYQIVIFTNQGGISLGADRKTIKGDLKRLKNFKEKISIILRHLDLPISVYAATNKDKYRKPRTGMWEHMLEDRGLENTTSVDLGGSYFVGDAAGRGETGRYAADHSCSDR